MLLAVKEQAERMTGRVEDHSDPLAISIRWLPGCLGATKLQRAGDRGLEVVDLDLEVHHLRLFSRLLGPGRRFVPRVALDVEMYAAFRVEQLRPTSAGPEITDLEPKKPLIEPRYRFSPLAVDREPYPLDPHTGNPLTRLRESEDAGSDDTCLSYPDEGPDPSRRTGRGQPRDMPRQNREPTRRVKPRTRRERQCEWDATESRERERDSMRLNTPRNWISAMSCCARQGRASPNTAPRSPELGTTAASVSRIAAFVGKW